jgi:hypothetical protein
MTGNNQEGKYDKKELQEGFQGTEEDMVIDIVLWNSKMTEQTIKQQGTTFWTLWIVTIEPYLRYCVG